MASRGTINVPMLPANQGLNSYRKGTPLGANTIAAGPTIGAGGRHDGVRVKQTAG